MRIVTVRPMNLSNSKDRNECNDINGDDAVRGFKGKGDGNKHRGHAQTILVVEYVCEEKSHYWRDI